MPRKKQKEQREDLPPDLNEPAEDDEEEEEDHEPKSLASCLRDLGLWIISE
jgi:hypothetical protein